MNKKKNENIIHLLILGNSTVGKSSIIVRYIENRFYDSYIATIGIDFLKKQITLDKQDITLQIWDSGGQERYKSASKQFLKKAQGILLVFDLTSHFSFDGMMGWLNDIENEAQKDLPVVIVGNKSDLNNRSISQEEAMEFAKNKGLLYFETSALEGTNIKEAFNAVTELVLKQKKERGDKGGITLTNAKAKKKFC